MNDGKVYAEVWAVLQHMAPKEVDRIPREILEQIDRVRDRSYVPMVDPKDLFNTSNIHQRTVDLLTWLMIEYMADPETREKLIDITKKNDAAWEEDARRTDKDSLERLIEAVDRKLYETEPAMRARVAGGMLKAARSEDDLCEAMQALSRKWDQIIWHDGRRNTQLPAGKHCVITLRGSGIVDFDEEGELVYKQPVVLRSYGGGAGDWQNFGPYTCRTRSDYEGIEAVHMSYDGGDVGMLLVDLSYCQDKIEHPRECLVGIDMRACRMQLGRIYDSKALVLASPDLEQADFTVWLEVAGHRYAYDILPFGVEHAIYGFLVMEEAAIHKEVTLPELRETYLVIKLKNGARWNLPWPCLQAMEHEDDLLEISGSFDKGFSLDYIPWSQQ